MALTISGLSKTYSNGVKALQDISLTIGNHMFGLLGPNGAGKSTLMRTIATLQAPDAGTISLDGLDVLNKNRLSYGEYTKKFEREFARLHDRRYAIFCNSGTSALQVAVHALKEQYGWNDGDEILVPAITFVASSSN